jgi:hypothetical protein
MFESMCLIIVNYKKKLELQDLIKPELNENKGYRFFKMLPHFFLSLLHFTSHSCDRCPSVCPPHKELLNLGVDFHEINQGGDYLLKIYIKVAFNFYLLYYVYECSCF